MSKVNLAPASFTISFTTPSVLRPLNSIRKISPENSKKPREKNGRNLRKSWSSEIQLPGLTVQFMLNKGVSDIKIQKDSLTD